MSFFAALALGICIMLGLSELGSCIKKGMIALANSRKGSEPEREKPKAAEVSLEKNFE
jgi:hypothetical protein